MTLLPIAGLDKFMYALKHHEQVFGPPWKEGMLAIGSAVGLEGQRGAPVRQVNGGRLQASVKGAVQKAAFPKWVAARVSARTPKPTGTWASFRARSTASSATRRLSGRGGYPYGLLLEYSPRHRHYYWLHKAMDNATGRIPGIFDSVGRKITALWESYAHK